MLYRDLWDGALVHSEFIWIAIAQLLPLPAHSLAENVSTTDAALLADFPATLTDGLLHAVLSVTAGGKICPAH